MRTSVAFCTALAASIAAGAPIVRVFRFEDWPTQPDAPLAHLESPPPVRSSITTEIIVEKGFSQEYGFHHRLRKHRAGFHDAMSHPNGHRRHHPWLRLLAWVFPPAHTGPKRLGQHSSMTQEEVGGHPRPKHHPTAAELEMEGARPSFHLVPCRRHGGRHFYRARKYADMAIVSIVFIFIGVVALIELWGPVCRSINKSRSGEGSIRLPDEEKAVPVSETPADTRQVDEKCGSSDDASADKAEQS